MKILAAAALIASLALVAFALVPLAQEQGPKKGDTPEILYDIEELPEPVRTTRDAILKAARSGDIENLRMVLERNELMPLVARTRPKDPIAFWKAQSPDGRGLPVMADMIEIMEAGYVRLNAGSADERYVWPFFAVVPLDELSPAETVQLYQLVGPKKAKAMLDDKAYRSYRSAIGPDGTWHYFTADD
jgi:hypothetical protein